MHKHLILLVILQSLVALLPAAETTFPSVTLSNEVVEVELSTMQGSLKRFRLIGVKPIEYYPWHEAQLTAQGVRLPDPAKPLAVLDEFNPIGGKHNWIAGIGIPAALNNTPWNYTQPDARHAIFTLRDEERKVTWSIAYELQETLTPGGNVAALGRPALTTTLRIENTGNTDLELSPTVYPINGIHQDDPAADAPSVTVGRHYGGATDNAIENLGLPEPGQSLLIPTENCDYALVKSRFFAALFTPGSLVIGGAGPVAIVPEVPVVAPIGESGGPPVNGLASPAAVAPGMPSLGANTLLLSAHGYALPAAHGGTKHAYLQAQWSANGLPLHVKPNQTLTAQWHITAAVLDKNGVSRLTDIERKSEFTEGYYRFFRVLAKACTWLLDITALLVRNYGVAILVLTFLIKLALHRTTFKQQESMMKMQRLQPELKLLQESYKSDKQKMAQKQMELWKKHGVNPLGGCLPIFIQIPIFTALYLAFCHSADMRGHGFLWIVDLTLPDAVWGWQLSWLWNYTLTINPLPIIYIGVTIWMSLAQKLPTGGDPTQEQTMKIMRWMPVFFGVIFYSMPSGLVLYFTANAVLSTIEIKMVKKKLGIP